jgi:hypothetical protein
MNIRTWAMVALSIGLATWVVFYYLGQYESSGSLILVGALVSTALIGISLILRQTSN